jgi:hypothetical protein
MVGGVSVALCSPHLFTNACKDLGFAFDPPLICHIMSDMDEAANFA